DAHRGRARPYELPEPRCKSEREIGTPGAANASAAHTCSAHDGRLEPAACVRAHGAGRRQDIHRHDVAWRWSYAAPRPQGSPAPESVESALAMGRSSTAGLVCLAFVLVFTATAAASTPIISYTIDGTPGTNGWDRGGTHGDNVILHWSTPDATKAPTCLTAVMIPGPTAGTKETCTATNASGTATAILVVKIYSTPPTALSPKFSRKPDYHGWYNHPVAIRWGGQDATSGIAGCSSVTYHGPDSGAATATGTCTDKAGNRATAPVHLAYDATP